jgi:hypothetical protein
MSRSLCAGGVWGGCGRVFASVAAFDAHRTGKFGHSRGQGMRRCMSEAEMALAGLVIHATKRAAEGPIWTLGVSIQRGELLRATQRKGMTKYGHSDAPRTRLKSA